MNKEDAHEQALIYEAVLKASPYPRAETIEALDLILRSFGGLFPHIEAVFNLAALDPDAGIYKAASNYRTMIEQFRKQKG